MIKAIHVPDIGDFSNVDVIDVLVGAGDTVAVDDALITLESDKAAMDIPAPAAGTVHELTVAVGDQVSAGSPILLLDMPDGATQPATTPPPAATPPVGSDAPSGQAETTTTSTAQPQADATASDATAAAAALRRVHASPAVRRHAREHGVDLTRITGSGRGGRITLEDVNAVNATTSGTPAETGRPSPGAAPAGNTGITPVTQPDWGQFGAVQVVPMSRIQKLAARHLAQSWLNTPQVTHFDEADVTELEAFRQSLKPRAEQLGVRVTPLAFIMKATAAALAAFARFNAALDTDWENFIQRQYHHIGIAVDTPDGLMVPVIRDVDHKGVFDLARELAEVSGKARAGKLKAHDLQGGCFTLSSLGGLGGTQFTPLVNAPQVGILGLTRSQPRLVRNRQGDIVDRLIQPLAVSYDHRVIDGAYAARFTAHLATLIGDIRHLVL